MIALSAIEARQRSSLKPRKGSNLAVPITISQTQAQGKGLVCGDRFSRLVAMVDQAKTKPTGQDQDAELRRTPTRTKTSPSSTSPRLLKTAAACRRAKRGHLRRESPRRTIVTRRT